MIDWEEMKKKKKKKERWEEEAPKPVCIHESELYLFVTTNSNQT